MNKGHTKTLLGFDCVSEGQRRPEYLSVGRHAVGLIHKLVDVRPSDGNFQITPESALLKFDKDSNLIYEEDE